MASKLDYRWNLRQVMAERGMFATTDLIDPLARRNIELSSSQVYRLVVERPERLSLKVLMALVLRPVRTSPSALRRLRGNQTRESPRPERTTTMRSMLRRR